MSYFNESYDASIARAFREADEALDNFDASGVIRALQEVDSIIFVNSDL